MANRLKTILPNVIFDAQSAFMSNRLITNNTTVAFEMLHRMRNRRKGKIRHMAVKLDISKAYDQVEWSFLWQIMLKIGLLVQWVHMAMEIVQTLTRSSLMVILKDILLQPVESNKVTLFPLIFFCYVLKVCPLC